MRHEVTSPMSGIVWKIVMAEQILVRAGDELIILESMKMEIPIRSPIAGVVVDMLVTEGASVVEGEVLAIVEGE